MSKKKIQEWEKRLSKAEEAELITILSHGKCDNCKRGKFSKCCQKKRTTNWIDFANNKRRYFCNLGCILLFLKQKHPKADVFGQAYHGAVVGGMVQ